MNEHFAKIPEWLFYKLPTTPAPRLLFEWLLINGGWAHQNGYSNDPIRFNLKPFLEHFQYSLRTIKDALRTLEDMGLIEIFSRLQNWSDKSFKSFLLFEIKITLSEPDPAPEKKISTPGENSSGDIYIENSEKTTNIAAVSEFSFGSQNELTTEGVLQPESQPEPTKTEPTKTEPTKTEPTKTELPKSISQIQSSDQDNSPKNSDQRKILERIKTDIAPQPLTPELLALVSRSEIEVIEQALDLFELRVRKGTHHPNPSGFIYSAIRGAWSLNNHVSATPSGFDQWFKDAYAQGLVIGATMIDGIQHVAKVVQNRLDPPEWVPWEEFRRLQYGG